jgi:hypothetical protein
MKSLPSGRLLLVNEEVCRKVLSHGCRWNPLTDALHRNTFWRLRKEKERQQNERKRLQIEREKRLSVKRLLLNVTVKLRTEKNKSHPGKRRWPNARPGVPAVREELVIVIAMGEGVADI